VVDTRRFHNDLVVGFGSVTLVNILGRQAVPGLWEVRLLSNGQSPWTEGYGFASVLEPNSTSQHGGTNFRNLTLSTPSSGADAGKLVLQGTATAVQNGSIDRVATTLERCATTSGLGTECGNAISFTDRLLGTANAVNVTSGQDVRVTVRLSFS
jgi:hypothetical protein